MIKDEETAALDAYDQGRIDTNERFIQVLERGNRETKTKEELLSFLIREMDPLKDVTEGKENEPI